MRKLNMVRRARPGAGRPSYKYMKAEVSWGAPPDTTQRCGTCVFMTARGVCRTVFGHHTVGNWCKLWEPRSDAGELTRRVFARAAKLKMEEARRESRAIRGGRGRRATA